MNNKEILRKKMDRLVAEVGAAKGLVDTAEADYLEKYKNGMETVIRLIDSDSIPASEGGVIGATSGLSESSKLASLINLYDAAADVDLYYSQNCKTWAV
ncbi:MULTISPECIES: hypothetical protein [unclassified Butyrivibrio]|uniref:hypothetical protein n=1 Tax=unclassified Butyrivibrio TaxID=2639466 RepID=UPI0008F176FA|nr:MULTISPECIES: hypothetical protein [unclassified Butyrivibrio]RKM63248.1 hypothetical protein D6856_03750 [Butyrivibrio sp. XB500-5]SFU71112.1 hypothetical protein SAMN02910342_01474 [Butyrivibrio sp. INlla21]